MQAPRAGRARGSATGRRNRTSSVLCTLILRWCCQGVSECRGRGEIATWRGNRWGFGQRDRRTVVKVGSGVRWKEGGTGAMHGGQARPGVRPAGLDALRLRQPFTFLSLWVMVWVQVAALPILPAVCAGAGAPAAAAVAAACGPLPAAVRDGDGGGRWCWGAGGGAAAAAGGADGAAAAAAAAGGGASGGAAAAAGGQGGATHEAIPAPCGSYTYCIGLDGGREAGGSSRWARGRTV